MQILTSHTKTSVRGFRGTSSGRTAPRSRCCSMFTPGLRVCGYRTVSGRSAWPSRDPLEEQGGLNLYSFIGNDSINANDFQGFINSVSALAHYIGGSGDPLRMSFNEIDTSGVTPSQFPDVKAKLPSKISVCKDEKISFGNAKMGFQTSGDQWLYLGRIVLKLQGTLTIKCGCS